MKWLALVQQCSACLAPGNSLTRWRERLGFENWFPEFGALGRPSSVLTGLAGITAAGLALAADRGEGPTAGMSDAVNSGLAAFGGGALVASGASGAFTPEEQVKSAGLSLTTEAKLASRSELPTPERGPAQKKRKTLKHTDKARRGGTGRNRKLPLKTVLFPVSVSFSPASFLHGAFPLSWL